MISTVKSRAIKRVGYDSNRVNNIGIINTNNIRSIKISKSVKSKNMV